MPIEYRPITDDELPAAMEMESWAFGGHFDKARLPFAREWAKIERSMAAFDGPDPVGFTGCCPLDMTVPGGSVTAACIGGVTVLPSHRRRGLLTEMMKRQITAAYESGLPLSALDASEAPIYGRFGYGIAVEHDNWEIDRHRTAYRQEYTWDGSLKMVKTERAREVFPEVYWSSAAGRAGVVKPPKPWWHDVFDDKNRNFYVEYRESDFEGYAIYQIKEDTVTVGMLMACSDAAYSALLQYCFGVDLFKTIKAWDRPRDEQLFWMLHDARALQRKPATERGFAWSTSRTPSRPGRMRKKARSSSRYETDSVRGTRATTTWSAARPARPAVQPTSRPTSPYPSTIWPYPTSEASPSHP